MNKFPYGSKLTTTDRLTENTHTHTHTTPHHNTTQATHTYIEVINWACGRGAFHPPIGFTVKHNKK